MSSGKPVCNKLILILGYTFPYCYEEMIREEIRPAVYRRDTVEELAEAATKAGKKAKVHIKVDTGMGGFRYHSG